MKVNLTIGGPELNGYLNLDPTAQENDKTRITADILQIDNLVSQNECSEFIALDVLDYLPIASKGKAIKYWMSKISHGGKIIIGGLDILEIARAIDGRFIHPVQDGNSLLYGACTNMWNIKKGLVSMEDVVGTVMNAGAGQFEIVSKKFVNLNYIVEARRK